MNDRAVTITVTGPAADAGPLDVAVVLPVVAAFGDALRLMIRHQHALITGHRPPYPALLAASALRLVAVDAGSGMLTLELAAPMALGELDDAPRDGLAALLSGAASDIAALPTEVDFPLQQIADGLPEGVNDVVIAGPGGLPVPALTLARESFDQRPPQMENLRYFGRLWEVNWRRGTAVLAGWNGLCILVFPKTMAETIRSVANRLISISGKGERTPDGLTIIRKIDCINIQPDDGDQLDVGPCDVIEPFEEDIQQALAIVRWEEKQREWLYDDELDAWADELLKDALEK